MKRLQKYALHPLTALLFAYTVAQFIHHFQLVEFAYASAASFVIVFVGYILLAQKYEASLSILFLIVALFLGYKAFALQKKVEVKPEAMEKRLIEKLSTLAALVSYSKIETGRLPKTLTDVHGSLVSANGVQFEYCLKDSDCAVGLVFDDSRFYIVARRSDVPHDYWYIDDKFDIYKKNQRGDNRQIFP